MFCIFALFNFLFSIQQWSVGLIAHSYCLFAFYATRAVVNFPFSTKSRAKCYDENLNTFQFASKEFRDNILLRNKYIHFSASYNFLRSTLSRIQIFNLVRSSWGRRNEYGVKGNDRKFRLTTYNQQYFTLYQQRNWNRRVVFVVRQR